MPATNSTSHSSDFAIPVRRRANAAERAAALLVELLDQIDQRKFPRRLARPVVAQHAERRLDFREQRSACRIRDQLARRRRSARR